MIKLNPSDIALIERILNSGDRVEIVPRREETTRIYRLKVEKSKSSS